MITCDFENKGKETLCFCLYKTIKNKILNKELKQNEKLPSKRTLAQHLGISVITVANAYNQLISEGYVYSEEKKGFFVSEFINLSQDKIDSPQKNQEKAENKTEIIADFKNNSIAYEKFPFSLWAKALKNVLKSQDEALIKSSPSEGILELREEIGLYLKKFRNLDVKKEQIIIAAGTECIVSLLVQLLGQNIIYAVENPGYKKIKTLFTLNGVKCIPINIDSNGIICSLLEENQISVVHASMSHHFPTGIVTPSRRRQEILNWATTKSNQKRYIIEDDYDSEFRFVGKPLAPLKKTDLEGNVIYTNTFSKTLSPSYRISYMVLPDELLKVYKQKFEHISCTVSVFEQYALASFMKSGDYEKHLIRMKNYYKNLRNTLIQTIQKSFLAKITHIHEKNAGLHFLLSFKQNYDVKKLQEKLKQKGIILPLVSEYFYAEENQNKNYLNINPQKTFLINYSGIKKGEIQNIVNILSEESQSI